MDQSRDFSQILMNVRGTTGNITNAVLFSSKVTLQLLIFLMRLAKKGLVAVGYSDTFKAFTKATEGKYTVYNIPLTKERAQNMVKLNQLEMKMEKTKKIGEKVSLRREIKRLEASIPELEQLKRLGIQHCVLPKINGSNQTIQVAVAQKSEQPFKNWFLNHITQELSGGVKGLEDLKVLTEGNYSMFNLPFEGEELQAALSDFDTMGINYAIMPDLKVGDNNSQVVIPNTDRGNLESWFQMWKRKQLSEGKEPGEMYILNPDSYMNTSTMEAGEYVTTAEPVYQNVNAQFEEQAKYVPQSSGFQKENCEEFVRLLQNNNYEIIALNKKALVDIDEIKDKQTLFGDKGYFISRVPGTSGDKISMLVLPKNQVFMGDNGQTFIAFLPKNGKTMFADKNGVIQRKNFTEAYEPYDMVERNFKNVQSIQMGEKLKETIKKVPPKTTPKL